MSGFVYIILFIIASAIFNMLRSGQNKAKTDTNTAGTITTRRMNQHIQNIGNDGQTPIVTARITERQGDVEEIERYEDSEQSNQDGRKVETERPHRVTRRSNVQQSPAMQVHSSETSLHAAQAAEGMKWAEIYGPPRSKRHYRQR